MRLSAALAILLLASPLVQAVNLTTSQMDVGGDLYDEGRLEGLSVQGWAPPFSEFDLEAAHAFAYVFREAYAEVPCANPAACEENLLFQNPLETEVLRFPTEGRYDDIQFESTRVSSAFTMVNAFPQDLADLTIEATGANMTFLRFGCLSAKGIASPAGDGDANCADADYDEDRELFTEVQLPEEAVRVETPGSGTWILEGSFVLEFEGIDGYFGEHFIETTGAEGSAFTERGFARIVVTDGRLTFTTTGLHTWATAAFSDVDVMALDAEVVMHGASLDGVANKLVELDGDTATARGDFLLAVTPEQDTMAVDLDPRQPDGSPMDVAPATPGWQSGLAWAVLASIIPLIGVALVVRRLRRGTTMADIEAALGAGEYPKAIRMTQTMLRRDPDASSVQLSHAIALTKAGRPSDAVAAVRQFLERREPADGTLHYVLGLALQDLGEHDEARAAMQTAMQLTPALATDRIDEGAAYT